MQLRLDAETRVEAQASLGGGTVTGNSARQERLAGLSTWLQEDRTDSRDRSWNLAGKSRAPWARASNIVGGLEGEGQTRSQDRESLVNALPRTGPRRRVWRQPDAFHLAHRRPCAGRGGRLTSSGTSISRRPLGRHPHPQHRRQLPGSKLPGVFAAGARRYKLDERGREMIRASITAATAARSCRT